MKSLFTLSVMALLVLAVMPAVLAVSVGSGVGVDIVTEDFAPQVWMCDSRLVLDDNTEPGRITSTDTLIERMNNYAFEGEQIQWEVLVMDKNGVEKIEDVFATIGTDQGEGNDIEVNCDRITRTSLELCNARLLEENLTSFEPQTMEFYRCTLTVETPLSMYGEHWVTVEAVDLDGLSGTMDENEFWFLNPEIELEITGDLTFDDVRPGTSSYSDTLLVGNAADDGSGVRLDMFISGTDFYDSSSSGALCPTSNQLSLGSFKYWVTHGAYSNQGPLGADSRIAGDPEGYLPIAYGIGFNDPNPFYGTHEILQAGPTNGPYWQSNILSPGAEMALTFRLNLPEPCNGDFDTGSIYFWGEAI